MKTNNIKAFLALLRAGLWEQDVQLTKYGPIDFDEVYQLAKEQRVMGLIAAGLEHVPDLHLTRDQLMLFLSDVFHTETRNKAMNNYIECLINELGANSINTVLVKGQGIAQCYARPLWRSAGDIDLLFQESDYSKAKKLLIPRASFVGAENLDRLHLALTIESWPVELHGSLRCNRLGRVNNCINEAQDDTFENRRVRFWQNGDISIQLPAVDNDVIFVFTHILQHFFAGGIGLRQICDWCRLLWVHSDLMDIDRLMLRLKKVRLMSEWRVFSSLCVNYLGMPADAMPFYKESLSSKRKASRLLKQIFRTGNFGQNRDRSYMKKYPYLVRKMISFLRFTKDVFYRFFIFPVDSITFYIRYAIYKD